MARLFEAEFHFLDDDGTDETFDFVFKADGPKAAVADAVRWWKNRSRTFPSHYHTLVWLRVWLADPDYIDANGDIDLLGTSLPFYNWEKDFPCLIGESLT